METEQVKRKIKSAIDAVQDVPEPFKLKAFEVVLSKMLLSATSEPHTSPSKPVPAKNIADVNQIETKIDTLAKMARITVGRLKDVYSFNENGPTFIGRVNGSTTEKQTRICQLLLLVMHRIYSQEWVKSSFLWTKLKDYGVGSLQHLNENLAQADFRSRGKKRGREYKLSQIGEQNALEFLSTLANG